MDEDVPHLSRHSFSMLFRNCITRGAQEAHGARRMQGKDKRVERANGQDAGFSGVVESDKQAAMFLI